VFGDRWRGRAIHPGASAPGFPPIAVRPAQAQTLGRVRVAGTFLLGLINDILNYARIEAGSITYEVEDAPLAAVVPLAAGLVEPQARAKAIRLGSPLPADCGEACVRADAEKTQQILLNLLTNAVKFTGPDGRVDLGCTLRDGWVDIHVTDTGRGIAPTKLEAIFEPFVQVDRSSLHQSQQGVGLGLAISRELARSMGGDITARSRLGAGSTFTLTLPRGEDCAVRVRDAA
jgi:signal transduction histidine kinase